MTLVLGDKEAIEKRKKSESAHGFAMLIRDAINEYSDRLPPKQIGKIMLEVGSTMFLDDDIQDLYDLVEALADAEPAIIYTESTVPVI